MLVGHQGNLGQLHKQGLVRELELVCRLEQEQGQELEQGLVYRR